MLQEILFYYILPASICISIFLKCAVKPSAPYKRHFEHVILYLSAFAPSQLQSFFICPSMSGTCPIIHLTHGLQKQPHKSRKELIAAKRKWKETKCPYCRRNYCVTETTTRLIGGSDCNEKLEVSFKKDTKRAKWARKNEDFCKWVYANLICMGSNG